MSDPVKIGIQYNEVRWHPTSPRPQLDKGVLWAALFDSDGTEIRAVQVHHNAVLWDGKAPPLMEVRDGVLHVRDHHVVPGFYYRWAVRIEKLRGRLPAFVNRWISNV